MGRDHHRDILLPSCFALPPHSMSFPKSRVLCSVRSLSPHSGPLESVPSSAVFLPWMPPSPKAPSPGPWDSGGKDSPSPYDHDLQTFFVFKILSNLQKSCKNTTKNSHIPRFPKCPHLTEPQDNDQNEETDMDALYYLICWSSSNFANCSTNALFLI